MSVACDKYGPFNGIYALEQSNWSNLWNWVVPEGIVATCDEEMEAYAQADGMKVYVKTGQAMLCGHRVWLDSEKTVPISAADSTYARKDVVVCRIVFGNEGASTAVLDVLTGAPAADPVAPSITKTIGGTYEIAIAEVYVAANAVTIAASSVTDRRKIMAAETAFVPFSSTSVTPLALREYRCGSALASLTVTLPENPQNNYIATVTFPAGSSFSGVTVKKGTTTISGTSNLKLKGDALNLASKTYTLVFWWDGSFYWCASAAA